MTPACVECAQPEAGQELSTYAWPSRGITPKCSTSFKFLADSSPFRSGACLRGNIVGRTAGLWTPNTGAELEQIYHAAMEQEPARLDCFLADACGDDSDLRREVESLLAQSGSSGMLVDRSAWAGAGRAESRRDRWRGGGAAEEQRRKRRTGVDRWTTRNVRWAPR